MTNEQRETAINEVLAEINQIRPRWSYLSITIQTNSFNEEDDQKALNKEYNELDNKLHELNKKLRELQVKYYVDYFDDRGILRTNQMMLNRTVDINTVKNGWNYYRNNPDARKLMLDIHGILLTHNNQPEIRHIITA
jgi:chromosome segregation ATPase